MKPEEIKKYLCNLVDQQVRYLEMVDESTDFSLEDWISGLKDQMTIDEEGWHPLIPTADRSIRG